MQLSKYYQDLTRGLGGGDRGQRGWNRIPVNHGQARSPSAPRSSAGGVVQDTRKGKLECILLMVKDLVVHLLLSPSNTSQDAKKRKSTKYTCKDFPCLKMCLSSALEADWQI